MRKRKYIIYKDTIGEYRWKLIASNGRNIRNCGEGYLYREHCLSMLYDDAKGEANYKIVEKHNGFENPLCNSAT